MRARLNDAPSQAVQRVRGFEAVNGLVTFFFSGNRNERCVSVEWEHELGASGKTKNAG